VFLQAASSTIGSFRGNVGEASRRVLTALGGAVLALGDQDRLILRLKFQNGRGIADIARTLQLEPKPLYRRLDALLHRVRAALEKRDVPQHVKRYLCELPIGLSPLVKRHLLDVFQIVMSRRRSTQIVVHEGDEPEALADLRHADVLPDIAVL
jgi:hypothetical protein